MPRQLRPRTNITQQPPPLADNTLPTTNEPQVQAGSPSAHEATQPARKAPADKQNLFKEAEPDKSTPSEPSRPADDTARLKSQLAGQTSQISKKAEPGKARDKQRGAGRKEEAPRRPGLKELPRQSVSDSRKSRDVANWVNQVHQEALPEIVDLSSAKRSLTVENYVRSTPWYLNGGYESPDDMESAGVVTTTAPSEKSGKRGAGRVGIRNEVVVTILIGRNARLDPVPDEDEEWIKATILSKPSEKCSAEEERNWKKDLMKCKISDEAICQRTIMMDLINRHQLEDTLDYTCESEWKCPSSMPNRNSKLASRMSHPKPDLAVAFQAESILLFFQQADLENLRTIMCPESSKEVKRDRAFHFLSMEVKGAPGESAHLPAHRQNLNTATQALHNMYYFMSKAGPELLEAFYKKVRFYSIVADGTFFHVRVHRAIELKKGRIAEDYPLGFEYDVIHEQEGAYSKTKTTAIIKNILIEYGVKILRPLLQQTMEKIWEDRQMIHGQSTLLEEAEE